MKGTDIVKKKLDIIILSYLIVFYPFVITPLVYADLGPESQAEIWTLSISAVGQSISGAENLSAVYIGIKADAVTFPKPSPPPDYTVNMEILEDLLEDYRQTGTEREAWNLIIEVDDKADASLEGFFPELFWNPNNIGPAELMELRLGDETGVILVDDMTITNAYQTKEEDHR